MGVRLMGFHIAVLNARRDPDEPFFLETVDGRRRPLRYAPAMDQFKAAQRAVGVAAGEEGGLHGLRVEGYNNSKRVLGEDVTVAHGLWKSDAHKRYSRFPMGVVAQIPAVGEQVGLAGGLGLRDGRVDVASLVAPLRHHVRWALDPPVDRCDRAACCGRGRATTLQRLACKPHRRRAALGRGGGAARRGLGALGGAAPFGPKDAAHRGWDLSNDTHRETRVALVAHGLWKSDAHKRYSRFPMGVV